MKNSTLRLTPLTTGRDNRSTLVILLEDTAVEVATSRQQCQGPQFPEVQRALVFLRDGSLFGYGLLTAQTGSLIVSLPAYLQACL